VPRTAIDGDRLWADLATLATFVDPGTGPYDRVVFGDAYAEGRAWLAGRMEEAGLEVRRDTAGNLIGRVAGRRALPAIATGSHTDTVLGGGRFDGPLGVLASLEVARALADAGAQLEHPLEVVDFVGEEPNRYGSSTVGSRAWAGTLDERLLAHTDAAGESLRDALPRAGANVARLAEARRAPGELAAYVELHIEQGPVLEREGLDVAIVSGIVAIRRLRIVLDGAAAHSGTTGMDVRRDALAAAAEGEARSADGEALATVGCAVVEPNAPNVVPGRVTLVLEARALDGDVVEHVLERIVGAGRAAAGARGVVLSATPLSEVAAARADPAVVEALVRGCEAEGITWRRLPSFAGHDASQISLICPFGMLFAPCRDGVSHHPDEWVEPASASRAAQALLAGILALDARR
jgi:N-carbamoyl-L-amino-acid hydrolase